MPRLITLTLALTLTPSLIAADWPQFLGPNRDSTSSEKPPTWGAGPKAAWSQPVGEAHSSPVVANGVVYAFFKPSGKDADALAAFDAATGEKKWEKSYDRPAFTTPFGNGPRSTPTVAGGKVYTFGSSGMLARWDAKTGDTDWKVDTLKEFNTKNLFFGLSSSPIVVGDKVIVMVGGKGAGVVAFDAATGKTAWHASDDPASYASPIVIGTGDSAQIVYLTGANLRALSPVGKELWAVPFKDRLNESSTTPVLAGNILIGSSVTAGSVGLKLETKDGAPTATQAWKDDKLTCYFSTPLVVGPHAYMVTGGMSLRNASCNLSCIEAATGKVLWKKERIGRYHAGLIKADADQVYMYDDNGNLIVFQPDATAYKEISRAKVSGPTWAHPALSDGRIYVRDDKNLIALKFGE